MTPAQLRALARQGRSRVAKLRATADVLEKQAEELERLAATAEQSLTGMLTPVNVNRPVTNDHRMNIARGQKADDPAFMRALMEHDFTQKKLAARLDITPALLSMYRSGKRPIPQKRAERVEELTGWKATGRNWPGGIVS